MVANGYIPHSSGLVNQSTPISIIYVNSFKAENNNVNSFLLMRFILVLSRFGANFYKMNVESHW